MKINPYIKNLFKRREDSLKYEMTVQGHKIYTFKSLAVTPEIREMMLRFNYNQIGLGIRPADLRSYHNLMRELLEKQDFVNMSVLHDAFGHYITMYGSERVLVELAGTIIIIDDEPLKEPTERHNKIKRDLVKDNKELRAFFLNTAMRQLQELGTEINISEAVSKMMSPQRLRKEKYFLALLGTDLTKDLWSLT